MLSASEKDLSQKYIHRGCFEKQNVQFQRKKNITARSIKPKTLSSSNGKVEWQEIIHSWHSNKKKLQFQKKQLKESM